MATRKPSGNQGGTVKTGVKTEIIVGRKGSPGLDFEINSEVVSGKHLRMVKVGSMVIIEDLGSSNGTIVDGNSLKRGEQRPIKIHSEIILAGTEKLDLNNPELEILFEGTIVEESSSGTKKKSSSYGTSKKRSASSMHRHDKFYPEGYTEKEEIKCNGKHEIIVIRVLSKDTKLRIIVFGEESQELIFNEEHSYRTQLEGKNSNDKREFLKKKIQHFLHFYEDKYKLEENWHEVHTSGNEYKNGGYFKLISKTFSGCLKTKVIINDTEMKEFEQEKKLYTEDSTAIKVIAQEVHEELSTKYSKVEEESKFPVNVKWLNNILKRLPFYKSNAMYSFYLFVVVGFFIVWLLICASGKFLNPKLKQGNKANFKDAMTVIYYSSIEEPLCGNLAEKCIVNSEIKDKGIDATKFKMKCESYCFHGVISGKSCNEIGYKEPSTSTKERRYTVSSTSSIMGPTTGPKSITLVNNTSREILVTLLKVEVDGESYPGMIEFVTEKKSIMLKENGEPFAYEVVFNNSYSKQLKGSFLARITFEFGTGKDKVSKSVEIKIEI